MQLVFEYQHAYGRLEPRADSWPKFLAGVALTARFTARQLYAAIAGPTFALAGLSSEGMGERMQVHHQLQVAAFGPTRHQPLILGPDGA